MCLTYSNQIRIKQTQVKYQYLITIQSHNISKKLLSYLSCGFNQLNFVHVTNSDSRCHYRTEIFISLLMLFINKNYVSLCCADT